MAAESPEKRADILNLRQHVIPQRNGPGYFCTNQSDQQKINDFEITRNMEQISIQIKNHSTETNIAEA